MDVVTSALRGVEVGEIRQCRKNLSIAALVRKGGGPGVEYLVLEEALESGKLTVTETQAVPRLEVRNETGHSVVLIAGEYLRGGGQNRMVAEHACLAPGHKGEISVRCVESRRWNAVKGAAFAYGGHAPSSIRTLKDQGEVWTAVDDTMDRTTVLSSTRDLSQVYAQRSNDLEAVLTRAARPLPGQVGVLAVVGVDNHSRLFALDLFDKPETLTRQYARLVQAHAVEALKYEPKDFAVSAEEIGKFLEGVGTAAVQEQSRVGEGTTYALAAANCSGTALVKDDTTVYLTAVSR